MEIYRAVGAPPAGQGGCVEAAGGRRRRLLLPRSQAYPDAHLRSSAEKRRTSSLARFSRAPWSRERRAATPREMATWCAAMGGRRLAAVMAGLLLRCRPPAFLPVTCPFIQVWLLLFPHELALRCAALCAH